MNETSGRTIARLPVREWYVDVAMAAKGFVLRHLDLPVVNDPTDEVNLPHFPKRERQIEALIATYKLRICLHGEYRLFYEWNDTPPELENTHHETLDWLENIARRNPEKAPGLRNVLIDFIEDSRHLISQYPSEHIKYGITMRERFELERLLDRLDVLLSSFVSQGMMPHSPRKLYSNTDEYSAWVALRLGEIAYSRGMSRWVDSLQTSNHFAQACSLAVWDTELLMKVLRTGPTGHEHNQPEPSESQSGGAIQPPEWIEGTLRELNAALGASESDSTYLERQSESTYPTLEFRRETEGKKKRFFIRMTDETRHHVIWETVQENRTSPIRRSAEDRQRKSAGNS